MTRLSELGELEAAKPKVLLFIFMVVRSSLAGLRILYE